MSLILLFLPHASTPANTQTLGPAVVYAVEMSKPSIYDVSTMSPELHTLDLSTPSMFSAQEVLGVFEDSTVTYSSATVEYSSATETYGGMDRVQPVQSILYSIDNTTPVIYDITKI